MKFENEDEENKNRNIKITVTVKCFFFIEILKTSVPCICYFLVLSLDKKN